MSHSGTISKKSNLFFLFFFVAFRELVLFILVSVVIHPCGTLQARDSLFRSVREC